MTTAAAECRALAGVVAVIAVVGVTSSVAGVADHVAAAALLVEAAGWVVVAVIGRQLRIRRRIADTIGTRPAEPRRSGPRNSGLRAGPGEYAPVPSVPHQPDPARHTGQLDAGGAVAQCPSMTSTVRGETTP